MSQPESQPQPQNIFEGPFAAFGQTISGLKDKISQIQAQRIINKDVIKAKLNELGRNIDELVNQTNRKLAPLAARNTELTQQVQSQQQQLQQLQQQLDQLQQQTQGLQQQIQQLTQEKQQFQQQLDQQIEQAQQVPGLQQQIQELNNSIQQKDQQISQANQEMSNITDKISQVNNALLVEIEKLNDLIGNKTNEEIINIIAELQTKLTNIINIFNNTVVGGYRRSRRNRTKNRTKKGGYVYKQSKSLDRSSSLISGKSKGKRTRRSSSMKLSTSSSRSSSSMK